MPVLTWRVNIEPGRGYQEWYAKQREQLKQRGYCVYVELLKLEQWIVRGRKME